MNRPITTLFMLESLDGKISSGSSDNLDADKDFYRIDGVKEGLHQYYELEQETDIFSLNTGRVMAKIGVNEKKEYHEKLEILYYDTLDLKVLLEDLYSKYNAVRLTIQSGGTLNGMFVRNKLIDFVNIVIAPIIVGGKNVATLVDGESITDESELNKLLPLQLLECNKLEHSYIELKYKVL